MDDKLNSTIDRIVQLTKQNAEFNAELRKRLGVSSENSVIADNGKIEEIYEYCINQITYKQALEFYKDFPIVTIKDQLAYDYWRMEQFRRKNNFPDFCLAMYQQIENITNSICSDPILEIVSSKLWNEPWFVASQKGEAPMIDKRGSEKFNQSIASFIFWGKTNGKNNSDIKSRKHLLELGAYDKMRIVVYFIGYKACPMYSDKSAFKEITDLLNELYQWRNTNHRGTKQTEYVTNIINKISPLKSFYYSKFHGLLAQYVDFIKNGYPISSELKDYALNLKS